MHLAEAQGDLETVVIRLQAPKLMLDDDGHDAGIFGLQIFGDVDAVGAGAEGDVEMMRAGQAMFGDVVERGADDAAQRGFDHAVVAQPLP